MMRTSRRWTVCLAGVAGCLLAILQAQQPAAGTAAHSASPRKWVAFGDSITVGIGASRPEAAYVHRLEQLIGPIDVRAVSATTIAQQRQAIAKYDGQADAVLWLTGYNDMRGGTPIDTVSRELAATLDLLAARHATVYLALCLPMTPEGYRAYGPQWSHGSAHAVSRLNAALRRVAARYPNVHLVDTRVYDPVRGRSPDLVHPNDAGHWQLARAFGCAITRTRAPEWQCASLDSR